MSLIVARKDGKQIALVSDTKLTYPDSDKRSLKNDHVDGALKIHILNENLCLAFAGEIDHAEAALKDLAESQDLDKILDTLKHHHKESQYKTEFLLCVGNPEPTIYKFKNNEYGDVHSSWIGDYWAFNRFQESMVGVLQRENKLKNSSPKKLVNQPIVTMSEIKLSVTVDLKSELFSKMSSAMDEVIEDDNILSVGGFKVCALYREKFDYLKYGKQYRGELELIGPGAHIIGHGSAEEGAYSINFFGGSSDFSSVALHIRQAEIGIVYHRENGGLLRPQMFKMDEVDFDEYAQKHFQIFSAFSTLDRVYKFSKDGLQAFHTKDYIKANELFDKALITAVHKQRAEILFYKGVTLLNLKNQPAATQIFHEAVRLDPQIQDQIKPGIC